MKVPCFKAKLQECLDRFRHNPLLPIGLCEIITNFSKPVAQMPGVSTTSHNIVFSLHGNSPTYPLSSFPSRSHPLKGLPRLFKTCEDWLVIIAHDLFIAENMKDRLGIIWPHLAQNQSFRLQSRKLFTVVANAHECPP